MRRLIDASTIEPGDVIRDVDLDGARLAHADLAECTFERCSLSGADLRNARLSSTIFRECNLAESRVAGARMFGTRFERCKLLGVDFHEIDDATAIVFDGCNLTLASFRGLRLDRAIFDRSVLAEADLSLTFLDGASFVDADLSNVELREVHFDRTDLRGATLTGWDLRRHGLRGTIMTAHQLELLARELGVLVV